MARHSCVQEVDKMLDQLKHVIGVSKYQSPLSFQWLKINTTEETS